MTWRARSWLPLLLCAAACSFNPPRRIYLLTPPIDTTSPTMTSASRPGEPMASKQTFEVRRILVPDYLDSTDMLLRSGGDEVKVSATGRWGERLSLGLTHALAADLAARMPEYSVVQDSSSNPARHLLVTITALDLWQTGRCGLAANWSIVDHDGSIPVTSDRGTFDCVNASGTTPVTDASRVEAVARTLGELADSIVRDAHATSER